MSKVTLKSLNAKYQKYGYQIVQNEYGVWWIVLDGVPKRRIWGRAYVQEAAMLMVDMDWLEGQSCAVNFQTAEEPRDITVNPTREAIKAASDADGGVDLSDSLDSFQETLERYTVSFRELARIESEKILSSRVDISDAPCFNERVNRNPATLVNKVEPKVMQVSHFDDVRAMNNRVSDADLYAYETSLQDEIFPEVKPEPHPVPATPVEVMQATDEMSEALVEIFKDGFYFDRLTSYDPWAKVETKKFIVYKNGRNFGKLEYDPTFKTWSFRLCIDGDYVYKPEGGYVSARQVRDAMIHHASVPF